jgi:hypothetical protein
MKVKAARSSLKMRMSRFIAAPFQQVHAPACNIDPLVVSTLAERGRFEIPD